MDGQYYNLWSTDNERTDANDDKVIKSVYDPSPVGYSLPASNAFTGFTTTGQTVGDGSYLVTSEQVNAILPFDKGLYFYRKIGKKGGTIFFPASGFRYCYNAFVEYMTTDGLYWSANTSYAYYCRYLNFNSRGGVPLDNGDRAFGFSVRSAEEKKS